MGKSDSVIEFFIQAKVWTRSRLGFGLRFWLGFWLRFGFGLGLGLRFG